MKKIRAMVQRIQELFVLLFLALFSKATSVKACCKPAVQPDGAGLFLSWRLAVEANNVHMWRTLPAECLRYIDTYMIGGQYDLDVEFIVGEILRYVSGIDLSDDGTDAWILDVDDTCLSTVFFCKGKRYGHDLYDPSEFKAWAMTGRCPGIAAMLELFNKLRNSGFKVFLVTGRDEENFGLVTVENLHNEGFVGYERLILRTPAYKGQSTVVYKSNIRKQLVEEGYKIWGNIGDQWSDLKGDYVGERTFKLPNPMYFVP